MYKKIFSLLPTAILLLFTNNVLSQTTYEQIEVIKVPGITTDAQTFGLTVTQKQIARTYYDGLGRSIQSVALQASPLQNDIIQPIAYDNLGRQAKTYLPYAGQSTDVTGSYRTNAISTDQPAFYNNTSQYLIANDSAPYAQQVMEASPLQRVLQTGTVGNGFQPVSGQHFKTVNYRTNVSGDGNIMIWNTDGTFTTGNYYAAGALSVTEGTDEDNKETLAFKDASGRIILKRQILSGGNLDTYYIYNEAGMQSYIVPPKAVALMNASGNYDLTQSGVNKLLFIYVYNSRGQTIESTVPGEGAKYIIYDPLNRPVLIQVASMRSSNKWSYTKYDALGRIIGKGIYTDVTNTSRASMQSYVTSGTIATNYASDWYETRSTSSSSGYYTNVVFPTANITPLSYNYYDNYDIDNNGTDDYSYTSQSLVNEAVQTTAPVKSMPTMVSTRTVGNGLSSMWLFRVSFYDKNGRVIQVQSNNQLNYTAGVVTDYMTVVPDFTGVTQISKVSKSTGTSINTPTVQTNYIYDHAGHLTSKTQQYNGGTAKEVAAYTYNELGQVIKKGLGLISGTTYLQNVDMRYNVRGQLMSINNSKLSNDAGATNGDSNDVFGMQFLYDQTDSNLSNAAYFNGKLSAVKWMSKDGSGTSSYERAYNYSYDGIDRYAGAIYAERATASTSSFTVTHGWDEAGITYDENGNIKTLVRYSSSPGAGTSTQIDNLTYTYDTANPNQLQNISDGSGSSYTGAGFRNLTGSTSNYSYDGDSGNLTADPYKGITSINYNDLNRTDRISLSSSQYIDYTYDSSGALRRKQAYKSGTTTQVTDYIDGFVYNNSSGSEQLVYFPMPEGRVRNNGGTLKQEYIITDQQGNARVSFEDNGSGVAVVRQESSYYGFGLLMTNSTVSTPTDANKKLYNGGSEWQNDYGDLPDYYQTFYRNFDAAIGRFVAVDPVAESAESMSSYQYAGNNPIEYNDPLGNFLLKVASLDVPSESSPAVNLGKLFAHGTPDGLGGFGSGDGGGGGGGGGGGRGSNTGFTSTEQFLAAINTLLASQYGGTANGNGTYTYHSNQEAMQDSYSVYASSSAYGSKDFPGAATSYGQAVFNYDFNRPAGTPPIMLSGISNANSSISVSTGYYSMSVDYTEQKGSPNSSSKLFDWYGNYSKANAFVGTEVFLLDQASKAGRVFIAAEPLRALKGLGIAGAVAGITLDGIGVYNYNNPTAQNESSRVSPGKFWTNFGVAGIGVIGGGAGAAVSTLYFGIDAYYPGGSAKYGQDLGDAYYNVQQQNPGYRSQGMFP